MRSKDAKAKKKTVKNPTKKREPKKLLYQWWGDHLMIQKREREEGEACWVSIGGQEANISKQYLEKNPQFKEAIAGFADNLRKQLGVDGIIIGGLMFQTAEFKVR